MKNAIKFRFSVVKSQRSVWIKTCLRNRPAIRIGQLSSSSRGWASSAL